MRMLMASDGSDEAREATLYGAHIARAANADVTLIGIAEKLAQEAALQEALTLLAEEISQTGECQVTLKVRIGFPEEQLLAETEDHFYHLVVIGARGERKSAVGRMGSTAQRLSRYVKVPLLIVTQPRAAINRVLICTSGEIQGESDALVGSALSALVGARVTVLHVMSQIPLGPEAQTEDLGRDALDLIQSGAREGEHFKRLQAIMQEQGLMTSRCQLKVRHGLVMDEIMTETREGSYDLVVIGAHQVPEDRFKGLRQLFLENIAEDILTHVQRPVLVVRALKPEQWQLADIRSEEKAE
jgi:nucleotide-binding universal stress UspA family protein